MKILAALLALCTAAPAFAASIVPARPIPAHSVVTGADVIVREGTVPGGVSDLEAVLGLEARVTLYPGRPIMAGDLGPPAIVDRNDIVQVIYRRGALSILAEGRALDRGAVGERIRIMNIDSRAVISGVLMSDKTVQVTR